MYADRAQRRRALQIKKLEPHIYRNPFCVEEKKEKRKNKKLKRKGILEGQKSKFDRVAGLFFFPA